MRMSFGAQIPGNQTDWSLMRDVAQTMDATRWSSAWTYDHFVPPLVFMDETGDSLEGWMTLAAIGEATETLMLGTLVSGVTYRNPGPRREDDRDARPQHQGPRDPRDRRRLARARARRLRLGLPARPGTL